MGELVDFIFSELDRWLLKEQHEPETVFNKLTTARELTLDAAEQLVSRRREQKAAADRLASAERDLAQAQQQIGTTPLAVWKLVRGEFEHAVKEEDLKRAARTLGLDRLASDAEGLKAALDGLRSEGERARVVTNSIGQNLTARWILFALAAITFLVPPTLAWLSAAIDPSSGLGVVLKGIKDSRKDR